MSTTSFKLNGLAGAHAEGHFFAPPFNVSDRIGKNSAINDNVGTKCVFKRKKVARRNRFEGSNAWSRAKNEKGRKNTNVGED
jgi:hypothetical protein